MLVLNEVARIVVVDIIVSIATRKTLDIIGTTQSKNPIDMMRMAESKIDGMVSAKASPDSNQVRVGVMLYAKRYDFIYKVVVILSLSPGPISGRLPLGIPAFLINTIHTK